MGMKNHVKRSGDKNCKSVSQISQKFLGVIAKCPKDRFFKTKWSFKKGKKEFEVSYFKTYAKGMRSK